MSVDHGSRSCQPQLLEYQDKTFFHRLHDTLDDGFGKKRKIFFERTKNPFSVLVNELLFGLAVFPFFFVGFLQVVDRPLVKVPREQGMIQNQILETGREVDFQCSYPGETVEQLFRQRGGSMLDSSPHPVFVPRDPRQFLQDFKIEGDFLDRPVRQGDASMGGSRLDADLRNTRFPRSKPG